MSVRLQKSQSEANLMPIREQKLVKIDEIVVETQLPPTGFGDGTITMKANFDTTAYDLLKELMKTIKRPNRSTNMFGVLSQTKVDKQ